MYTFTKVMEQFRLFMLIAIHVWISTATEILYVIPDNSTNATRCMFYSCATLSQYFLDNNNTLPVISNVQYYFLPGEHQVPANIVLQNFQNFSMIGSIKKSSPSVVLVGCLQLNVIGISNSYNVTIANVLFKQCNQLHLNNKYLASLLIDFCYSCTVHKVAFMNLGLKGTNLIGISNLTEIVIKSDGQLQSSFCQGISLTYWDKQLPTETKHLLILNQIHISRNKCYNSDAVGIHIVVLNVMEDLMIVIKNSVFYNLDHMALSISSRCSGNNTIIIKNCSFENNTYIFSTEEFLYIKRPSIAIVLSHSRKSVTVKQCSFINNYNDNHLISIFIREKRACYDKMRHCIGPITNVTFVRCRFARNKGELINAKGIFCRANLLIIGPSKFANAVIHNRIYDLIIISNMGVHIIGPVIITSNRVTSIIYFKSCEVSFYRDIMLVSNRCDQLITLQFTYIRMMENSNITLFKNKVRNKLIDTNDDNEYNLYPLCIFQFVTLKNTTNISSTLYSVNIIDNSNYIGKLFGNRKDQLATNTKSMKNCSFPFYYFTPHCQWIPNATFYDYNPRDIYQQIIKIHGQNLSYHEICHCPQNGSDNCSIDTLGPVYPGQTLQLELCTPCNDEPSILYAEVSSIHLPNSTCKVASHTETNVIHNYSKPANFTIVSEATNVCKLFLATSSHLYHINEAFYVKLLSCPVGFTLQSGVCDCDPVFSTYTDKCYIDYSAIEYSANTWITPRTSYTNNTEYLISNCPMDYCLPYSSKINLLYPDTQCQFNLVFTVSISFQYGVWIIKMYKV